MYVRQLIILFYKFIVMWVILLLTDRRGATAFAFTQEGALCCASWDDRFWKIVSCCCSTW